MIVAPGCLASSRAATSAVIALRRDRLAALVDHEAAVGVAVEGEPEVGAVLDDRAPAGRRMFAGSSGFASWLGKVPSSSK